MANCSAKAHAMFCEEELATDMAVAYAHEEVRETREGTPDHARACAFLEACFQRSLLAIKPVIFTKATWTEKE